MLLAALLCYAGLTALCLSMDRHHADLFGHKPTPRRRLGLKLLGWLSLGLSLWAAVVAAGWGLGVVQWFAELMLSALLLVLLMPYRPRLVLSLAGLSLLASPITLFAQY